MCTAAAVNSFICILDLFMLNIITIRRNVSGIQSTLHLTISLIYIRRRVALYSTTHGAVSH